MSGNIVSRVIKTEPIKWKGLKFIQQDGFKEHRSEDKTKLKQSLIDYGFCLPFNVWQDPEGVLWCLDGYHRESDMREMEAEGVMIPELLPANFIRCTDKKDAAMLVLVYSSQYAKITQKGFADFVEAYRLELPKIADTTALLIESNPALLVLPEQTEGIAKNKPASMRITFADEAQLQTFSDKLKELLTAYPGAFYSVSCGEL